MRHPFRRGEMRPVEKPDDVSLRPSPVNVGTSQFTQAEGSELEVTKQVVMDKTFDWLRAAVYGGGSAALTGLAWLLGGWDEMLEILIVLIVVDYLAALLEAWDKHNLNSTAGWHGIAKKTGYLLVVLVAHFVDRLTGSAVPFVRTVVIGILAVNECLSIVEHAGALGVPVPKALIDRIEKLRAAAGGEGTIDA